MKNSSSHAELSNKIKCLAISLTSQVDNPKCTLKIAKSISHKATIVKLIKALNHYKGSGYEIDATAVPIELTTISIFDNIELLELRVYDLRDCLRLLTKHEAKRLNEFLTSILSYMEDLEARARNIVSELKQRGLTLEDVNC